MRSETLFGATLWRPALEKFSAVIPLTVELYDGAGVRAPWGPIAPTPLFQLFAEHGWDPGLFAECAKLCLARGAAERAVEVTQAHGLAVVGTAFVLAGEVVGAAVGGYVLVDFAQVTGLQRLARTAGLPFSRIWQVARDQQPVSNRRLGHYGELLQVLGDALLRENERTRQVEDTADHLTKAAAAMDDFLAILAHELRGPLAPLGNMLEVLKRAGGDAGLVRLAGDTMERQLSQMVRLVDDLLDVSRISRGKIRLRTGRVDLAAVVAQAVETTRPLYESMNQELTVTLPPEPMDLNADAARLVQVLGNLLNNACKFTGRGGRIWLTVEREGGQAVIRVRDTGIGIAADQLPCIFERFTQVDTSLERTQGGLGIGLTLVRDLVKLHGGTVAAHSAGLGQGSEFVVRLPDLVETPRLPPPEPTASEPAPTLARRILVVDDNRDSADSLARLLELAGNQTQTAYDGLEAVEAAAAFRPDVVLLDIGMPKLNGYEAARRIREEAWGQKMVLVSLTGWGQDEDREKSREAGFNEHMVKPVDLAALRALLAATGASTA